MDLFRKMDEMYSVHNVHRSFHFKFPKRMSTYLQKTYIALRMAPEKTKLFFSIPDGSLDPNALPNQRTRICLGNIKITGIVLLAGFVLHRYIDGNCIEVDIPFQSTTTTKT